MTKYTPIRIDSNEDPFAGIGRQPLFYLDGEEFTIPVDVPASYAIEALEDMATMGDAMASRKLMVDVLGDEGYAALRKAGKRMTRQEFGQIQNAVRRLVFGDEEEPGKD
jgi:hypothetical protein